MKSNCTGLWSPEQTPTNFIIHQIFLLLLSPSNTANETQHTLSLLSITRNQKRVTCENPRAPIVPHVFSSILLSIFQIEFFLPGKQLLSPFFIWRKPLPPKDKPILYLQNGYCLRTLDYIGSFAMFIWNIYGLLWSSLRTSGLITYIWRTIPIVRRTKLIGAVTTLFSWPLIWCQTSLGRITTGWRSRKHCRTLHRVKKIDCSMNCRLWIHQLGIVSHL